MKTGLALSGGGILSLAHVGILKELERNGIAIDMIAGTSSGAIIGALYADGGLAKIEAYIKDLNEAGLFRKRNINLVLPSKVFAEIRRCLKKNLSSESFSKLKIEFSCAATNITNGEPVMLDRGNLVDAIMASAAYLSVFSPQEIGGKYLVDGGISRNMPARALREMGADFVIGSSLYSVAKLSPPKAKKISRIEIALRAIAIMQKELANYEVRECDFCFFPPVNVFRWYSFDRAVEISEIGEKYARRKMPKLKELLEKAK